MDFIFFRTFVKIKKILIMSKKINTLIFLLFMIPVLFSAQTLNTETQYSSYDDYPVYNGNDLGVQYSFEYTIAKLWSPVAEEVKFRVYKNSENGQPVSENSMIIGKQGVWYFNLNGDWKNYYYTFQIKYQGKWLNEVADPYAVAVGVNGDRGLIVNDKELVPDGWNNDQRPELKSYADIILYEAHIRDISIASNSGIANKGKFIGLTETETKNPAGQSTGLDHFKEMGITHLHILPSFDFKSIDETKLNENNYNWGYDPKNYNVPEGSYSVNPYDGKLRNLEYRKMVQALHKAGIRVVMDVVYNHTGDTDLSNFNQLVPGYYYRHNADGSFSDAAACGNETASEKPMMRNFLLWSVKHWAQNYHVDGFRFDLMAIHDIETMNLISKELRAIDPTIFIYGEGWTAGASPLPQDRQALKNNVKKLDQIAVFSDDIRDGIKGHWSDEKGRGFVSGNPDMKEAVKFGIVASTFHPQVQYDENRSYAQFPYSDSPLKVIGYVSCHDNHTLYDKLKVSNPTASEADLVKMDKLANSIVLTSQSVPFFMLGEEMKRTKKGVENSYKSPDAINEIDWNWKMENKDMVEYYKSLIQLRKNHPAFKMPTQELIQNNLTFLNTEDNPLLIGYTLKDHANGDSWENITVFYNGGDKDAEYSIQNKKDWYIVADGKTINENSKAKLKSKKVKIPAYSMVILAQK